MFVFTPRIKVISISLLSQDAVVILGRNKLSHLTTERCDFRNVDTSENYTNLDPIDLVVFYSTQMLLVFFLIKIQSNHPLHKTGNVTRKKNRKGCVLILYVIKCTLIRRIL